MALVACAECGAKISTRAPVCPQCGAKRRPETSTRTWIYAGMFAFIVGSCTIVTESARQDREAAEATKTPAQKQSTAKADAEAARVAGAAMLLKSSLKKPETFRLERGLLMDGGVVCLTYTARNSFNDVHRDYFVASDKMSSGSAALWNQFCAGKTGTDYSYVSSSIP